MTLAGVDRGAWRSVSWLVLAVVAVGTLVVGVTTGRGERSEDDRATDIKRDVQCPVCNGQNVLESNAPVAVNIRDEIDRLVAEGRSEEEIFALLADTYGDAVLLNPSGEGLTGLVWVLPVAALAVGAGGLGLAFARWRSYGGGVGSGPTEEDRQLVEAARRAARAS